MINNFFKLKANFLDMPSALKLLFWEFIRGDKPTKEFEQDIYSSKELPLLFNEPSYDHLLMVDYKDRDEVYQIKKELFYFLTRLPLNCLCPTICNATKFSITNQGPYKILDDYTSQLLKVNSVKTFFGKHPIHNSDWYFDAELNKCKTCNTLWFTVKEECDCNYYFVRLNQAEFDVINSDISWPNEKWPESIMSWEGFTKNNFIVWNDMYVAEKYSPTNINTLENFLLCINY